MKKAKNMGVVPKESPRIPQTQALHDNPDSILTHLSEPLRTKIDRATRAVPGFFSMGERELRGHLERLGHAPTETDSLLRLRMWGAFEGVLDTEKKVSGVEVYGGVISRDAFFDKVLPDPYRCAWLMCPPAPFLLACEEGLAVTTRRLREMAELDPFDRDAAGKAVGVDKDLAKLILSVHDRFERRVHGAHAVEARSLPGYAPPAQASPAPAAPSQDAEALASAIASGDLSTVQSQMERLRGKQRAAMEALTRTVEAKIAERPIEVGGG